RRRPNLGARSGGGPATAVVDASDAGADLRIDLPDDRHGLVDRQEDGTGLASTSSPNHLSEGHPIDKERSRMAASSEPGFMAKLNGRWHERALWIYLVIVILHWMEHLFQAA